LRKQHVLDLELVKLDARIRMLARNGKQKEIFMLGTDQLNLHS